MKTNREQNIFTEHVWLCFFVLLNDTKQYINTLTWLFFLLFAK